MNKKITHGNEMYGITNDPKTVAEMIFKNSVKIRKKEFVTYRPYKKVCGIEFDDVLSWQKVDFDKIHQSAREGDGAYIDFDIVCSADADIYLNVSFNTYVTYNGEQVYAPEALIDDCQDMKHIEISVKKNARNSVRIFCRKAKSRFDFRFLISVKRYPFMWANDYLFWARAVLPSETDIYEEGVMISELVTGDMPAISEKRYITPKTTPIKYNNDVWYLYTEVAKDGKVEFSQYVKRIYINGKEHNALKPVLDVKKGDRILACVKKKKDEGCCDILGENTELSWVLTARNPKVKQIILGPFKDEQKDAGEFGHDMSKVYKNEYGDEIYWKLTDGSELRIYLDSVFFGQWFYALMVGLYGIRQIGEEFDRQDAKLFFDENMQQMAKYFSYIRYEIKKYKMPTFMPRIAKDDVLDNLGTMGMNFVDAFFDTKDDEIIPIIKHIEDRMENAVPRFPDGTYYRIDTMWADDLYMSCPFLVRMGKLTGNREWFQKAINQVMGFKKRLFIEKEKLFSHIYFTDKQKANCVPWGRGNGWVMWTISEILLYADKKVDTSEIKTLFCDMAESLKKYQSQSGLWRQVIDSDDEKSYIETSCTGMFLLAFIRGVKNKWLDDSFIPYIERAWEGLLKNSIDSDGNIYGVCMGSGCAMEKEYYYTIPTALNDDHGTGVILTAAAEYYSLLELGKRPIEMGC